jgi:hypothetical protein
MERKICVMRVLILCTIFILLIPAALMAEDKSIEYTIKKGDTLWMISSGKLKDPFMWPKLWEANPKVHNPHLIFPDQVILIPGELLKDSLKGEIETTSGGRLKAKKRLVPAKVIASKYLPAGPKKPIVSREVLLDGGFFSRSFIPVGKVALRVTEKTILGNGDAVYISASAKLIPDTKYYVGNKVETIRNPVGKNEIVGYLVRIKGVLQIVGEENKNTKAIIIENFKEIYEGDVLLNYYPVSLPYEPLVERKPPLEGTVIGVDHERTPGGRDDIVYLNKGAMQGMEIGDIFTVSSGKAPHPVIGTLQVFSVFDEASIAIVKNAAFEITPGDTFGN